MVYLPNINASQSRVQIATGEMSIRSMGSFHWVVRLGRSLGVFVSANCGSITVNQ